MIGNPSDLIGSHPAMVMPARHRHFFDDGLFGGFQIPKWSQWVIATTGHVHFSKCWSRAFLLPTCNQCRHVSKFSPQGCSFQGFCNLNAQHCTFFSFDAFSWHHHHHNSFQTKLNPTKKEFIKLASVHNIECWNETTMAEKGDNDLMQPFCAACMADGCV